MQGKKSTSGLKAKPLIAAIGTAAALGLAGTSLANSQDNPFSNNKLQQGYMMAEKGKNGGCGGKMKDGSCGEKSKNGSSDNKSKDGNCGDKDKKDDKKSGGQCGAGRCGGNT